MRCYACNQPNTPTARFCVECGASLALTAPAQPLPVAAPPAMQPQPVPAEAPYAPVSYAPTQPPQVSAYASAPETYPPGAAGPANAYAAYGYAPAPAPYPYAPGPAVLPQGYAPTPAPAGAAPSMVNTVTVNQVAPSPPPPTPAPLAADHGHSGLTRVLSALFFLASGTALGVFWVAAAQSDQGAAIVVAMTATLVVLLLNIMVIDRLAHK